MIDVRRGGAVNLKSSIEKQNLKLISPPLLSCIIGEGAGG